MIIAEQKPCKIGNRKELKRIGKQSMLYKHFYNQLLASLLRVLYRKSQYKMLKTC